MSAYIDSQTGSLGAIATYDEIADLPQFTKEGDQLEVTKAKGQPLETLQFVGGNQRENQVLGIAVGSSSTFVAGDFGILDTHPDPEFTVPIFTGDDQHLAIFYQASDNEQNVVRVVGDEHNYIGAFGAPVALLIGAVDGYYISTTDPISATRSGDDMLSYNETGLPTFVRYGAIKPSADGNAFVAADFTGTDGFSSTTGVVRDTRTAPDLGANYYRAVAVPDDQRDVTGILSPGFSGYEIENLDRYERQSGTIEIGGVDYKVWRSTDQASDVSSMDVLILQEPVL